MRNLALPILFFLILALGCQKRTNKSLSNGVLFTIDNQPVLAEEFIYLYEKNNFNNDSIYTQGDIDNYLKLFVNFKLKVKAAYEEGIDTTEAFQKEFNSYKAELIKPYLLETQETDSLIKETYTRLQSFISASHILITVKDFSNPEDTLKAYTKLNDLRIRALAGEDFNEMARQHSDDPSAEKNGGNLGYFTAMRMVYPFEDAAYKTPVDSVSEIVKTQFGYHIIKVHEKVPNKGKVKIAHIMVSNRDGDTAKARNKIFEIYDQAVADGDWNYLVTQFSDDERTKANGGELGFIGQGQLPGEFRDFEEKAFQMEAEGELGGPVETPYGWHILKLLEKQEPESFEDLKEELKRSVARGDRSDSKKALIVEKLKKDANFIENRDQLNIFLALADSTLTAGLWKKNIPDSTLNRTIFLLNRQSVPVRSFNAYIIGNQKRNSNTPEAYMKQLYDAFVEKKLYEYEEQQIATKHLNYRMLEKEYREGLLLFEVMEENVWNKSMTDTVGIKAFYEDNKEEYRWKRRASATIASVGDDRLLEKIKAELLQEKTIYFTTEIPRDALEIPNNVFQMIKKYPESEIVVEYNPKTVTSDQIEELKQQLERRDIKSEAISLRDQKDLQKDVILKMSSKSKKVLEEMYNTNSALTLQIEEGVFEEGENMVLNEVDWEAGLFKVNSGERNFLVKIDSVLPEATKPLSEIKGKVISDYQSKLEKDWIAELKDNYQVVLNEDVLKKIYKYFESK